MTQMNAALMTLLTDASPAFASRVEPARVARQLALYLDCIGRVAASPAYCHLAGAAQNLTLLYNLDPTQAVGLALALDEL